jgi:protein SCO1/2
VRRITPPLRLATIIALAAGIAACASGDRAVDGGNPATSPAPAESSAEPSVYDLDLTLTAQDGQTLALADLRGRPVVAAMIYTSCTTVCPRIAADMRRLEGRLSGRPRDQAQLVLFSLDPDRDTPAALRQFAATHGLTSSRWRLFATSEEGVRDLAAALGVKYKAEEGGGIAHSALIFAIDPNGVVRHRQVGLSQDIDELRGALDGM